MIMLEMEYERYLRLRKELEADEEYRFLQEQRRIQEAEFLRVLESMTRSDREIVCGFLGICEEMGIRELELACFRI